MDGLEQPQRPPQPAPPAPARPGLRSRLHHVGVSALAIGGAGAIAFSLGLRPPHIDLPRLPIGGGPAATMPASPQGSGTVTVPGGNVRLTIPESQFVPTPGSPTLQVGLNNVLYTIRAGSWKGHPHQGALFVQMAGAPLAQTPIYLDTAGGAAPVQRGPLTLTSRWGAAVNFTAADGQKGSFSVLNYQFGQPVATGLSTAGQ